MGIDPAWGSSAFGIVVTQWADGIVEIMHAEEYHRPDDNEMLSNVYELMSRYQVDGKDCSCTWSTCSSLYYFA
jgi:hypothetical protein